MIRQWIEYSLVNLLVSTPLSYVLGMAMFTSLQGTRNFPFVWMRAKSIFLSPRPRYKPRPRYLNTSVEVLKKPQPRVCKALDRGISSVEVLVNLKGYKSGSWSIRYNWSNGSRNICRNSEIHDLQDIYTPSNKVNYSIEHA